jgi:L-cysteine:1D-myo-inositol 2-amino-2-deoxy-alpha-D-glucopyranoside ligase
MRLFNTLTQQLESLRPLGDEVTLYVCGITPYDTTHLGHVSINVIYDTLIRFLQSQGRRVNYVQNVTDIDDDILRKARELSMAWCDLGQRETDRYLRDLRALNVIPPTHYVRATENIPEMIALIRSLVAEGHAYVRDGWVYFSVKSDPAFGSLAEAAGYIGYDAWLATANERGNTPDDPRKRDPLDFVLWQGQQPDEPVWESPWGPGRPGWHIECSAMATKYLGPRVDLHGGGADLIFPHHTCEIAQSENATHQRPFVQIWMHCGMVRLGGAKMSKSLGNLILADTLLQRYSADAVRVLILSHHYRESWDYTDEEMVASAARAERLATAARGPSEAGPIGQHDADDTAARQAADAFSAALENDLETPRALVVLEELAGRAATSASAACMLRRLAGVLGLTLDPAGTVTATEPAGDEAASICRADGGQVD